MNYADYVHCLHGFRQKELVVTQVYDERYLSARYGTIPLRVAALAKRRFEVLKTFVPKGNLLDYGSGTGQFIRVARAEGWDVHGHDVVYGTQRPDRAEIVTFFDSLEHLVDPFEEIRQLQPAYLMISIPECHYPESENWFMSWKHRRPGEHLWHWNRHSLDAALGMLDYRMLMTSAFEDEYRPPYSTRCNNILTVIYKRAS